MSAADRRKRRKKLEREITERFLELCDLQSKPLAVFGLGIAGSYLGPEFVRDGSIRLEAFDDFLERVRKRAPHDPTPLDTFLDRPDDQGYPLDALHAALRCIVTQSPDAISAVLDLARVIKRVVYGGVPDPRSLDMVTEALVDLARRITGGSSGEIPVAGPPGGCGGHGDGVLTPCLHRRRTRNDLAPTHRQMLDIWERVARDAAQAASTPKQVRAAAARAALALGDAEKSAGVDLIGPSPSTF